MQRRNKIFATLLPGAGQLLEGRTTSGALGLFLFFTFVCLALLIGRLAPVLSGGHVAKLMVRSLATLLAVITWLLLALPVWRRRTATV